MKKGEDSSAEGTAERSSEEAKEGVEVDKKVKTTGEGSQAAAAEWVIYHTVNPAVQSRAARAKMGQPGVVESKKVARSGGTAKAEKTEKADGQPAIASDTGASVAGKAVRQPGAAVSETAKSQPEAGGESGGAQQKADAAKGVEDVREAKGDRVVPERQAEQEVAKRVAERPRQALAEGEKQSATDAPVPKTVESTPKPGGQAQVEKVAESAELSRISDSKSKSDAKEGDQDVREVREGLVLEVKQARQAEQMQAGDAIRVAQSAAPSSVSADGGSAGRAASVPEGGTGSAVSVVSSAQAAGGTNAAARQVLENIQASLHGPEREITLTLRPAELGTVRIRFEQSDEQITGVLHVERQQTRQEIQRQLPQLIAAIQQSGVQVRRIDVVDQNGSNQQQSPPQQQWQNASEQNDSMRQYHSEPERNFSQGPSNRGSFGRRQDPIATSWSDATAQTVTDDTINLYM